MKKNDYNHGKFTIATNKISEDDFYYEDYVEYCEDMDIEAGDKDSDEFYDWCAEETYNNFECDLSNIKSCKQYNVPVAIEGSLGLWWGKPTIEAVVMDNVYDAIMRCIEKCDYVTVEFDNGVINVFATHHDGTNCFTIHALSNKGIRKNDNYNTDFKDWDFKRLPYLYAI